jgi:hypothetical protein
LLGSLEAFARSLFLRQKFPLFIAKVNRDDLAALCELMKAGKMDPGDRQNVTH